MPPARNSIVLGYSAVGLDGDMGPIFSSAARPIVAQVMLDANVRNRNTWLASPRVDGPPRTFCFATLGSLPATQRQRWGDEMQYGPCRQSGEDPVPQILSL